MIRTCWIYTRPLTSPHLCLWGPKPRLRGKRRKAPARTHTHTVIQDHHRWPFFLPPLHRFQHQIRSQFNPNLRRSTFKLHLATGIISGGILRLGCLARWLLSKQRGGNRGQPNLTSTSQLESSSADKRSPEAVGIAAYRKLQPWW